jgi:hypothetical protein
MADLDPRIVNLDLTPRKKDDKGNWVTLSPVKIPVRLTPNTGGGFVFDVNVAAKGEPDNYQRIGSMVGSTFSGGFDDRVTLEQTFGDRAGSKRILKFLEQSGKLSDLSQLEENEQLDYITQALHYGNSKEGFLQIRQENFNILNENLEDAAKNNIVARVGHENYITKPDPEEPVTEPKTDDKGKAGSEEENNTTDQPERKWDGKFDINPAAGVNVTGKKGKDLGTGPLSYPEDLATNQQDYLKISCYTYKPQTLSRGQVETKSGKGEKVGPDVYLPINSASDTSAVGWGEQNANPLQIGLYQAAASFIDAGGMEDLGNVFSDLGKAAMGLISQDEMLRPAIKSYFAGQAAGVNGMLARTTGAVFNPNIVLLFNSPELRKFSFSFRMSARSETEATMIRKIIRYFKQYSRPGLSSSQLFLTTPYVFTVQYKVPGDGTHKSIGQPKDACALTSVGVNYVPDGSYMTFNDEARTMTTYELTLNFSELEPIYRSDYTQEADHIGW